MMKQELLHKYFRGTTSIEEEKQILNWVEASEENREAFLKERMLYPYSPPSKTARKEQRISFPCSVGRHASQQLSS